MATDKIHKDQIAQELYQEMHRIARDRIPEWTGVTSSDPSRILLESVTEFASELYQKIRPESDQLFAKLPSFFKGPVQESQPVAGVVLAKPNPGETNPLNIPAGSELFAETLEKTRRFVTLHDTSVFDWKFQHEHRFGATYDLGLEAWSGETILSIYFWNPDSMRFTHFQSPQIRAYALHRGVWQEIACHDQSYLLNGYVHLQLPDFTMEKENHQNHQCYWLRLAFENMNQHSEDMLKNMNLLFNAIEIEEHEYVDELDVGRALAVGNQTITLEVYPHTADLSLQIEGDRDAWSRVTQFAQSGPDSKHFIYDAELNTIRFGDGVRGAVPGPGGARIMITHLKHKGSLTPLERGTISELVLPEKSVIEVTQPHTLFPRAANRPENEIQRRFQDLLWTRGKIFSLSDFSRAARSFDRGITHAMAYTSAENCHQVDVVVYGPHLISDTGDIDHQLLIRLTNQIQQNCVLGQSVKVKIGQARLFRVEASVRLLADIKDKSSHPKDIAKKMENELEDAFGPVRLDHNPFGQCLSKKAIRNVLEQNEIVALVTDLTLQDVKTGVGDALFQLNKSEYPQFELQLHIRGLQ